MTAQPTVSGRRSLLLLAWVLLAGLWASGGVQALMQPWCSEVDTALVGWNISSTPNATHKLCRLACLDTPGCQSANYWYRTKVCELNSVSHLNVSGRYLVEKPGSLYTFSQQETGCDIHTTAGCHDNEPEAWFPEALAEWRLVFKGVAGTGVKLYDMWTTEEWDSSYEVKGHYRDNSLYQAWGNGQLNVRKVKFSLYNSTGVLAELVFNGTGSDTVTWFTQARLVSSPWDDLKSANLDGGSGEYFSMKGHVDEYMGQTIDRRFFINQLYKGKCLQDEGWLIVAESGQTNCLWESNQTAAHPLILYSTTDRKVVWNDLLSNAPAVGIPDGLTIHMDAE